MKVLVADDHEFVRGGMVTELAEIIPQACFLQAGNANEALRALEENTDMDLAIMDLYMPGSNKYALINRVCKKYPKLIVVVLTASQSSRDLRALIDCGVSAYIPKTLGKDLVHQAIRLVLSGETYFPEDMLREAENDSDSYNDFIELEQKLMALTDRQKQVLELLLGGFANKEIASRLNVAENTVKIHVTAILKTLNLSTRAQVIAGVNEAGIKSF